MSEGAAFAHDVEPGSLTPSTEVSAAMLEGGPALLGLIEAHLAHAPRPFSCLLAEVR
jgi:hypothetical protein